MKCAGPKAAMPMWGPAKIGALLALVTCALTACAQPPLPARDVGSGTEVRQDGGPIRTGAERTTEYLPLLEGRRVGVITNQTGRIGDTHLVDSLLEMGVEVVRVFAPEHGFRGEADAGEHVKDQRDDRTGLPIVSLYGANKKPSTRQLMGLDMLVFDIQDVGVRFYTYISTLHYVMEAAAESELPLVVLDRPNPHGFYVDGPVLDTALRSFVGMHPVPLVHGMTIGEYARMINGEGWLNEGAQCALTVVPCLNYDHGKGYHLPVPPSPNLQVMGAVYLYPSLGLFEGTVVSVGRGTTMPFQCFGYPDNPEGDHSFTPVPAPGAKDPPYKHVVCKGFDLSGFNERDLRSVPKLRLNWLIGSYRSAPDQAGFFTSFFDKLAGTRKLREHIVAGWDEARIRSEWVKDLQEFMPVRDRYLLYDDFDR